MKRILAFLPVLIMLCLLLAGCGAGRQSTWQEPKDQSPAQEKAVQPVKEGSVTELFAKGQQVRGMSYEYVLTTASGEMKGKVWLQDNRIKTDAAVAGQRMISFFNGETNTITTYYPDQNKAVKLTADRQPKTVLTPKEYMGGVDSARAKLLEKTVYDGASCRVVLIPGADGKEEVRMWVREDYGIPVRVEVTSAAGEKTVMEYKNLRVGPLPPDTFALPPGVEVTDLNKMLEQLPSGPGGPVRQLKGSSAALTRQPPWKKNQGGKWTGGPLDGVLLS
jgi:outer membrane lipoprotein-sorting protein